MRKINHESNTFPNFISKCINFNYGTVQKLGIGMIFYCLRLSSLNFDKECLFGFETLVFVTSGILSMHKQLVTLLRERKT